MKTSFYNLFILIIYLSGLEFINSQFTFKTDTSECTFPFNYQGKDQYSCITTEDVRIPWCSLNREHQGVWTYCEDRTKPTNFACISPCSNEEYSSCFINSRNKIYCVDKMIDLTKKRVGNCSDEYKKISQYHTACLPPQKYLFKSGLSDELKKQLLDLHNDFRRNIDIPAKSMFKLYWDEELAYVAQKHADRCSFPHDDMNLRKLPGRTKEPGQNIAYGGETMNFIKAFTDMFIGEKVRWAYGIGIKAEYAGKSAGHYTQLVLGRINKVGCGMSECVFADRIQKFFVCDYNEIQLTSDAIMPYEKGDKCSGCGGVCDNGLCDCGPKECINGVLNPMTCKCDCDNIFFQGEFCEIEIPTRVDDLGCVFPFEYQGKLHYECINDEYGYWCSTTKFYQVLYADCEAKKKRTYDQEPNVFDFELNGDFDGSNNYNDVHFESKPVYKTNVKRKTLLSKFKDLFTLQEKKNKSPHLKSRFRS